MRAGRRSLIALIAATLTAAAVVGPATAAEPAPFTKQTLHFDVAVGPGPGGTKRCDIVGDLYLPVGAGPKSRVPAILTTNGFGGSKDDQAWIAEVAVPRGYAVLSYSGLGFGGSGCEITLDDREWDGVAAAQLVSFLGGASGIAYTDAEHTEPVPPLNNIVRDKSDHSGVRRAFDPRVGMIGGSYGGQIQFAAASVDPRIDALIPLVTWNDLTYSITPNNTALRTGVTSDVPGALNLTWATLFFAAGAVLEPVLHTSPDRFSGTCPNFPDAICGNLGQTGILGYAPDELRSVLRHASVATYLDKVRVPTLLVQGQHDTLFNLNEAIATYRALQAQGTPVKMIWSRFGHSGAAAPGELGPDPSQNYLPARFFAWFERYLKRRDVSTGPEFSYFRDWVGYQGSAAPAYANSSVFPVGSRTKYYLSGDALVRDAAQVRPGAQSFGSPPGGPPSSVGRIDAVSRDGVLPDQNLPGTFAAWSTPPLSSALTVVGAPSLRVRIGSPTGAPTDPLNNAGDVVLYAKVYDVAPDGTARRVKELVAPVRITDFSQPVQVTMPAFAHRFQPGHQLRLVIASGDVNHRGSVLPAPVTIETGGTGQVLELPVVR